jgi:hypothetical protein
MAYEFVLDHNPGQGINFKGNVVSEYFERLSPEEASELKVGDRVWKHSEEVGSVCDGYFQVIITGVENQGNSKLYSYSSSILNPGKFSSKMNCAYRLNKEKNLDDLVIELGNGCVTAPFA